MLYCAVLCYSILYSGDYKEREGCVYLANSNPSRIYVFGQ